MASQTTQISIILIFSLIISLSLQATYQAPGLWPPSNYLIAVVHHRGILDSTFLFDGPIPAHSRIQGAYLAVQDSGSTAKVETLDFRTLEANALLTVSWIEATSASHPISGLFLSYSTERAHDFASPSETWTFSDSEAAIPDGNWNTNIYHAYVGHDQSDDLTCNFEILYRGFVRAIIVNDHNYGGFGSSHDLNEPFEEDWTTSNYQKPVILHANMLNVLTIIIKTGGIFGMLQFTNCDASASFNVYQSEQSTVHIEDIVGPSTPTITAIGFPTTRQESDSVAIDCEAGYFLDEGACVSICMSTQYSFYTSKCMGVEDIYTSIQHNSNSEGAGSISYDIYFDFDTSEYPPVAYLAGTELIIIGGVLLVSQPQYGAILPSRIWIGQQYQSEGNIDFSFKTFVDPGEANIYFFQKISDPSRQFYIYRGGDLQYGSLDQTISLPDEDEVTIITFFLGCLSTCDIKIQTNGEVTMLVDNYLFKLNTDLGANRTVLIKDDWSQGENSFYDYHKIELYLEEASSIKIQILGPYDVFINGPVTGRIRYDTSGQNQIDCSAYSGCAVCDAGKCVACGASDSNYLAEDKQSCVSPDSCDLVNDNTLSCVTNCESPNLDLYEQDGYCYLSDYVEEDGVYCQPGYFYFIMIRSCFQCPTGCFTCSGYNRCDSCEANYVLRDVNCLPDYQYSLNLKTSSVQYYCQDIVIEAQLLRYNPVNQVTKQLKYGTGYSHSVEITGGIASQNDKIFQIVDDSNARKLIIPSALLEIGMTLQFSSVYTSTSRKPQILVSSEPVSVNVLADLSISIEGSPTIDIKQNEFLTVKGQISSGCNRGADDLDISWSQISGNDVEGLESPITPLWLQFDSCSFDASSAYEYRLTVSDKSGKEAKTIDIEIQTATEFISFDVDILQGSRQHVFTQPLIITGNVIFNQLLCPSTTIENFAFSCQKSGSDCDDPLSIFGPSETNIIAIPENYFVEDEIIEITLEVTISGETKSKTVTITMKSAEIIPVQLSCSSAKSCAKYINDGAYTFTALTPTFSTTRDLIYEWTVSEPSLQKVTYLNSLKLLLNELTISDDVTIEVVISHPSTSREGRASIVLASNTPPSGGSFSISPTTGEALSTAFTLTASNWVDDDTPLTYIFYYKLPSQSQRVQIGQRSKTNKITTQLPGGESETTTVTIYVDVYDGLNAVASESTTVTVTSSFSTITSLTSSVDSLIASTTKLDPFRSLNKLQLASNTIRSQEENFENEQSPTYISSLIKTKTELLSKLKEQATNILNDEGSQQMIYEALDSSSKSIKFNNLDSQKLARDILDNELNANDEDTIISTENSRKLSNVLDNFLSYAASEDCSIRNEFSISLKERTQKYLQKISNSNLANQSPNQEPFIQTTELFDVLLIKVTPAELSSKTLSTQPGTPEISFDVDLDAFEDEFEEFWIQYYVFKNQIFGCSEEDDDEGSRRRLSEEKNKKGDVGLRFRDKNGNDVKKNIKVKIKNDSGTQCPESCDCSDPKNYECDDLNLFDVGSQISRIFEASNFGLIGNFDALLSFQFWKSAVFWALIVFTLWFAISMVIIHKRLKNYDSLEEFLKSCVRTRKKAFIVVLLITHPLFGIYYHINPKIIKQNRALLYYCRMILVLAYVAIFGDLQKASKGEYQFKIYLIFIPFITYIPIFKILTLLVENSKDKDEQVLTKCQKFKVYFGIFMTFAVIIGSYVIILTISAQKLSDWQRDFSINFAIVAFLDIIFNPIGAFVKSIAAYTYYRKRQEKMGKLTKKVSEKLIGEEMLKIMANVREYGRGVTYMLSGKEKEEILQEQALEKDIEAQSKQEENGKEDSKHEQEENSNQKASDQQEQPQEMITEGELKDEDDVFVVESVASQTENKWIARVAKNAAVQSEEETQGGGQSDPPENKVEEQKVQSQQPCEPREDQNPKFDLEGTLGSPSKIMTALFQQMNDKDGDAPDEL